MGDETKRTDEAKPRKGAIFIPPPEGLDDVVAAGGKNGLAQSFIDLCAHRTAFATLSCALHQAHEDHERTVRENGDLRTSLSLLTTTERQLRDALQESRNLRDRMKITMEQQTVDIVAHKVRAEAMEKQMLDLEEQLKTCRATIGRLTLGRGRKR